ncbi:hypothetical protein GCM10010458_10990 [Microbacterium luteolum]
MVHPVLLRTQRAVVRPGAARLSPRSDLEKQVGILDEITGRFVYFHGVRPNATWHPESLGYRLRSITAVEIGRRYFAALSVIAGEGPERDRD